MEREACSLAKAETKVCEKDAERQDLSVGSRLFPSSCCPLLLSGQSPTTVEWTRRCGGRGKWVGLLDEPIPKSEHTHGEWDPPRLSTVRMETDQVQQAGQAGCPLSLRPSESINSWSKKPLELGNRQKGGSGT